jgi:predicted molibdopterin-dependent oxidoreductase YjgC
VYDEMRHAMNSIAGITWERLLAQDSVTYPCRTEDDPGQPVVFTENFPTKDGRGRFVPCRHHPGERAARRRVSRSSSSPAGSSSTGIRAR